MAEPPNYVPYETPDRTKQIQFTAYIKWREAGSPSNVDGKEFWVAAEKEWDSKNKTSHKSHKEKPKEVEPSKEHHSRYIAVKGVREVARGDSLQKLIETVTNSKSIENSKVGCADIVIWDMGTPSFPMMSVAASTSRGWFPIAIKGRQYVTDLFGVSFSPKEAQVLKQFFEVWALEGGQTVVDAIRNIYEQTYVKDFKPEPGQIKLNRDEFKVFVNKLLQIVDTRIQ